MITKEQITSILEQVVANEELFIVDVQVKPGNKISIAIDSNKGINIDTCASVSRAVEAGLDREKDDFELEVSSPGLLLPFKVKEQYIKYIGKQIEVLLTDGEKFKAILKNVTDTGIEVEVEGANAVKGKKKIEKILELVTLNFNAIKHTKLVLTF